MLCWEGEECSEKSSFFPSLPSRSFPVLSSLPSLPFLSLPFPLFPFVPFPCLPGLRASTLSRLCYLIRQPYLQYFGYHTRDTDDSSAGATQEALENLQKFAGLEVTGRLDGETINLLRTQRCGKDDADALKALLEQGKRRKKRYYLQGSTWKKSVATFPVRLCIRPNTLCMRLSTVLINDGSSYPSDHTLK